MPEFHLEPNDDEQHHITPCDIGQSPGQNLPK